VRPPYSLRIGSGSLLATAVHDGHDLRAEVASRIALDDRTRLREEDPGTGAWTIVAPSRVVAHRSRFELDLNRARDEAVYRTPDAAWGLEVWTHPLPPPVVERSLAWYDRFYEDLGTLLGRIIEAAGGVLVYDLHSYNHRRSGPSAASAPDVENPDVNLGTQWIDRDRWRPVVDAFLDTAGKARVGGRELDARENVRFHGGHLSGWISREFPERACVLAIEVKKIFMDEWTGELDEGLSRDVRRMLSATVRPALRAFRGRLPSRSAI
jgi:N-formylglutamate amidohydrolase